MSNVETCSVLRITQFTTLKRRPVPVTQLGFRDQVATSPLDIPIKSHAAEAAGETLQGHVKVELEEPCHGSTTWYVDRQHCLVTQAPVESKPKASQPIQPFAVASKSGVINPAGLEVLKGFEGLELEAYTCPAGVLTIGYGSTFGVKSGDRITAVEAEDLLKKDLKQFEDAVRDAVKVPLTANQFSALVCFAYNIGTGAFQDSTLLKLLNQKDYQGAADQFLRWNKANGEELEGLTRRRKAERELFLQD